MHEREEIDRQRGTALSHPLPTDTRMESNRTRSVRAEPATKEVWSPAQITPPLEAGEPLPRASFTVVPSRRARSYSWARPDGREAALHVVKGRSCCLSARPAKHDRRHVSRETYPRAFRTKRPGGSWLTF